MKTYRKTIQKNAFDTIWYRANSVYVSLLAIPFVLFGSACSGSDTSAITGLGIGYGGAVSNTQQAGSGGVQATGANGIQSGYGGTVIQGAGGKVLTGAGGAAGKGTATTSQPTKAGKGGVTVTGFGGSAGTVGAGGTITTTTTHSKGGPPCVSSPSQVVIVGDSYINWVSHTLPADLASVSGQDGWRMYALGGAAMAAGGIAELIPAQFEDAVAQDPNIVAVVMDGGGNDVLVADALKYPGGGDCKNNEYSPSIPVCQEIVKNASDTAHTLWLRMAEVGVRDVVYFWYPTTPVGTIIGGGNPNPIGDYSAPIYQKICEGMTKETNGKLNCYFVDMRPVFDGHPEYFAPTDVHPDPAGSAAMAKAIWERMVKECVAQPTSASCCSVN
jgi:hypothetical protein